MQQIDFSSIKEYDSLSKKQQQLLREIAEEKERSNKIKLLIEKHLARRSEIKSSISEKNTNILDKESQVKVLREQKTRLMNQGSSEEKLNDYESKISTLEEESFAMLEEIEELERELQETLQFEEGARKTLSEIEKEVEQLVGSKETELRNITSHLEGILNQLPERVRNLLIKLSEKKMVHGPFTKIEAGSCMMCRFKISKTDEADIDVHRLLKQCPQCSRIFLPYGV
ncbi:MAG TPA: hypothetical protein VKZ84_07555 [Bacteriovoracaceae bacterium]|nr:hypothetical protein [Bacteriovoracaceae bacterium]